MTTRMIHPQHGAMHAYDRGEIERLKSLGWSIEGEQTARVVGVDVDGDGKIDKVFAEPKKKPGRPKKA